MTYICPSLNADYRTLISCRQARKICRRSCFVRESLDVRSGCGLADGPRQIPLPLRESRGAY